MIEEYLKLILGSRYNETLVDFYIEASKQAITEYLNVKSLDEETYSTAIAMLTIYLFNSPDTLGLDAREEGDVSYTFGSVDIPNQIKAMLPKPKVRFV